MLLICKIEKEHFPPIYIQEMFIILSRCKTVLSIYILIYRVNEIVI